MKDFEQLQVGSVLSEISHYKVLNINKTGITCLRLESNEQVKLGSEYVSEYIDSGDEITQEVKVTREDKKDGSLGIRSIFDNIHTPQVFTVCFKKQDKPKSQKALQQQINAVIEKFSETIDRVKTSKKGVASASKELIAELIENPILPYEAGEERVLRGYKVQFESRDGRYNCVDMDIDTLSNNIRPVNINTIKWLVYNGTKYIVE